MGQKPIQPNIYERMDPSMSQKEVSDYTNDNQNNSAFIVCTLFISV